jgi:hypothetical protein
VVHREELHESKDGLLQCKSACLLFTISDGSLSIAQTDQGLGAGGGLMIELISTHNQPGIEANSVRIVRHAQFLDHLIDEGKDDYLVSPFPALSPLSHIPV